MRLLRVLVVAASFAALLAQPSAAQEGRPFRDAWFWGVKGGVLAYSATRGTDNSPAPMAGIDWLITRSRGGLYVSADQSFFRTTAFFGTPPYVDGISPYVSVQDLRRFSLVGMLFPQPSATLHPYIGLGGSLHQAGAVQLETVITLPALRTAAQDSIVAKRVAIAPMAIVGVQKRLPRFSMFAQATGTWLQDGFFLHHPNPKRGLEGSLEAGIRYNVGSSIER